MEGSSHAAKKACVRRVPRARARARPVHVLLFIVFEGWQLRVGERREIERGVARMHEELEQRVVHKVAGTIATVFPDMTDSLTVGRFRDIVL
eukprot:SAG25_NODE_167_length_13063_cov_9.799830_10_plen_92_part_00